MNNVNENNEKWLDKDQVRTRYIYHGVKRVFDFIASLLALVVLSPVFLIVALCIKSEDWRGPVMYSQIRLGIDGRKFKMKEDPRITKVGKFIRKYSLDELPQLYNVLIGDMSLVGPRPPLIREVKEYTDYDKQRLLVQPGCTGLWQVSGRNALGFSEMVELDLKYIEHSSVMFDIIILFKTVKIMIIPNDAY
ncbi:sugar transferase [Pediococcus parvulus]|uniref:sugar transferase n=1 Tax=Pediococcus parvulus TaxID=54062 RepID=UPI0021A66780|nr:sugar transferase [Pediococcus parvulus]MCT3030939.1 sugar transferase [Pediococcus parvulus]